MAIRIGTLVDSNREEVDLAARARSGDRGAADELIANHLPYWIRTARAIASREHDAEDLVQGAVTQLLALWGRGDGPTSNVRAYVTTIMRNTSNSFLRSPRSRWESIHEAPDKQLLYVPPEYAQIDIAHESQAVRRAMGTLSLEHREVLLAVTVNGQKPGELVENLERPAPAISNLLSRAKAALRRSLLVEYLSTGDTECKKNAPDIPTSIKLDFVEHDPSERGMRHICGCAKCKKSWRRFAAISSALGALPLLALSQFLTMSPPLLAAMGVIPVLNSQGNPQDFGGIASRGAERAVVARALPSGHASLQKRRHGLPGKLKHVLAPKPVLTLALALSTVVLWVTGFSQSGVSPLSPNSGPGGSWIDQMDAPELLLPDPAAGDRPVLEAGPKGARQVPSADTLSLTFIGEPPNPGKGAENHAGTASK